MLLIGYNKNAPGMYEYINERALYSYVRYKPSQMIKIGVLQFAAGYHLLHIIN
jgi:hypothetical protein